MPGSSSFTDNLDQNREALTSSLSGGGGPSMDDIERGRAAVNNTFNARTSSGGDDGIYSLTPQEKEADVQYMDYLTSYLKSTSPDAAADAKRMRRQKAEALMDGIGGALNGIANMIGGIGGGYAFPEEQKPATDDPIERERRERADRAQHHFDAQRARYNHIREMGDTLRRLRRQRWQDNEAEAEALSRANEREANADHKEALAGESYDRAYNNNRRTDAYIRESESRRHRNDRWQPSSPRAAGGSSGRKGKIDFTFEEEDD